MKQQKLITLYIMTDEQLKKYREQIERLKRDFHGENTHNIENRNSYDEPKVSIQKPAESSLLSNLKNLNTFSNENKQTIPEEIKPKSEEIEIKKVFFEFQNKPKQDVPEIVNEIKTEVKDNISETFSSFRKTEENIFKTQETKSENPVIETTENKIKTCQDQTIPPRIAPANNDEYIEEKKSSIFKYILMLFAIVLLGFVAYYFYDQNKKTTLKNEAQIKIEKQYSDSILAYAEALKIQKEIEEKNALEAAQAVQILISDTIFNLKDTTNLNGYYAIIGSFAEKRNANETKKTNKTSYTAFILNEENTDKIRLGLKISNEESQVFLDLEEVRKIYPQAWVLFNKN